jgi:hypothetical protein
MTTMEKVHPDVIDDGYDDAPALETASPAPSSFARRGGVWALFDPDSPVAIYLGLVIALAGFLLLFVGWARVAGLTNVSQQMPYVMSAGLPGLGLVMSGLVLVNVATRRRDAAERLRQIETMTAAVRVLQDAREDHR